MENENMKQAKKLLQGAKENVLAVYDLSKKENLNNKREILELYKDLRTQLRLVEIELATDISYTPTEELTI